jgi:hypothetical protein
MSRFKRSDRLVERKIRGDRILVPIAGAVEELDSLYTLNETAALIWDKACAGCDEAAILDAVVAEYEVAEEKARADVARVLNDLVAVGALSRSKA